MNFINFLGYINLNDACLSSNSDLSTKMPKTSSDCHRKLSLKDPITSLSNANSSSFHHGASIFHCRSSSSSDQHPQPPPHPQHSSNAFDCFGSGSNSSMSGRQSRFEYCNSYYSNFNQFASTSTSAGAAAAAAGASGKTLSKESNLNDFQSEENLFNMNFDSFYEDFVDSSAELSWSSTSSASSTSYDSSSISSMYDKKYVVLPEIKLDNELMRLDKVSDEKALMVAAVKEKEEDKDPATSGKLRCYQCNKKLGIIMIMKCHCNQYFCSAHRYMEMHNCSYDFKENGRKKLERENPLVCTQKLPKI